MKTEILDRCEVVYMGSDCWGNDSWAVVPKGSLCPVELGGKYLFDGSAAATRALHFAREEAAEAEAQNVCECCPNCRACGAKV